MHINSSLTCLGRVILGLSKKEKHIPFRDSKLTRILQNYMEGDSYVVLIATIYPINEN